MPSKKPEPDVSACHLLSRWFLAQLIFSTLKMEAICSSETSVDTQRTTRRYLRSTSTFRKISSGRCLLIFRRNILPPTSGQQHFLVRWFLPIRLHGVITQKTTTRIFTAVKSLNLIHLNMIAPNLHNKRQSKIICVHFQETNSRWFSTNIAYGIK
jgi:hypothetical protein